MATKVPRSASYDELVAASRPRKRGPSPKPSPRKYRWQDPSGKKFTAAGILFYDDEGIWVIGETEKNGIVYNDIGGKYMFEDGNIWTTIRRELTEETYGLCDMLVREIEELAKKYPPVAINGHDSIPTYMCLVVPLSDIPKDRLNLDPAAFTRRRDITLQENPDIPSHYYSPVLLTKLRYDDIRNKIKDVGFRLKRVLSMSSVMMEKM